MYAVGNAIRLPHSQNEHAARCNRPHEAAIAGFPPTSRRRAASPQHAVCRPDVPTRTGKSVGPTVVWGMPRNLAAGRVLGKTAPLTSRASTASPGYRAGPRPGPIRSRTVTASTGWRSPSRRSSPRAPGSGSSGGWKTTSATPPATPRSRPCCRAWPPARAADTPTTAATRPPPRVTRSTTTGASAATTTRARRVSRQQASRTDYLDRS
jgi:hypothetical protein